MNTTAYSQIEFEARQQQKAEQMQAALAADPGYQNAVKGLEKAQADLDHLQTFIANQRTLERRLQYNPNLIEAKANVTQAERAALTARNAVFHQAQQAKIEAEKQAKNQAQTEQQARLAAEQEAQAKKTYKASYLAAGGTEPQFEAAWVGPNGLWEKELQARAAANVAAVQHSMGQRYAL